MDVLQCCMYSACRFHYIRSVREVLSWHFLHCLVQEKRLNSFLPVACGLTFRLTLSLNNGQHTDENLSR